MDKNNVYNLKNKTIFVIIIIIINHYLFKTLFK